MSSKVINRDRIAAFLDHMAGANHLVAPAAEDGVVRYRRVKAAGEVALDGGLPLLPPKSHFLPRAEEIYSYNTANGLELKEPAAMPETVLFGVRPCDLRSLAALDPVFGGKFTDRYYQEKREKTTIIGLSCGEILPTCFCRAFGGSPTNGDGADLLFTRLGDVYLVEILTPKGEQLVQDAEEFFTAEGVDRAIRDKENLARELGSRFTRQVDLAGVKEKADTMFDSPYWVQLARSCLGCGICTFLCPTCHCFDIIDEKHGERDGCRVRCQDSCMFADFTLHTSGHNPRVSKTERVRNRFLHKLKYHLDRYGVAGCVGCGRCVAKCPVNIDITRVIAEIKEVG